MSSRPPHGKKTRGAAPDTAASVAPGAAVLIERAGFRQFSETNIVGVVICSATGQLFEVNDYYLRLTGFTRAEFDAGMLDWRAITPRESLPADERAIQELRAHGASRPYEKEYLLRDGTRILV